MNVTSQLSHVPPGSAPSSGSVTTALVSVVIPAFNHERFIAEAIASAAAQGDCVAEILVVDDGSTDQTAAVIAQLREPRLRLLRQPNAGPSAARNTGWRAARGEWIQFLDADDTLPPDALTALLTAAHAAPGKIPFGMQTVHGPDITAPPAFTATLATHGGSLLDDIALRYHGSIFTALIPRAALQTLDGFRDTIRHGEDFDFALRLAQRHEFVPVTRPTYRARMHGANRHAGFNASAREQYLQIVRENLGPATDPAGRRRYRRALAHWLWHLGRRAQQDGDPTLAHACFRQSWQHQPLKLGAWRGWCETLFARGSPAHASSAAAGPEELHQRLRAFYNESHEYFAEASGVNRELTPERAELFRFIQPGDRVLDVGCGACDNAHALAGRASYTGCDISFLALRRGAAAYPEFHLRFAQGESQRLPFATGSFSIVLSTYALEHFVFPRASLDEMWRVCRPGGKIILISPAYDDPRLLPPSTSHWSRAARLQLLLAQTWRQAVRHFDPHRFYFARVQRPRVLHEKYQSDFDAVHLVSAREIAAFFAAKGATFAFERKRRPRPVTGGNFFHRLREHLRNIALRLHLGEYAGLNLQLVAVKPATA